jgi:hypothetical protein
MKHLLNNMTESEKNAIREQHAGGMKVMTENFNKFVNSKSGDVKPLISEQVDEQGKMKWNGIKKQFSKYNPTFRTLEKKGKLMYGTNPFKTYKQEVMTISLPNVGQIEITYPYSETEGPDYESNFVKVSVENRNGIKVPLDFSSIIKTFK